MIVRHLIRSSGARQLGLVKAVTAVLGWLSGSLAAIGAVFYAFGYLITLSNLQLLGLDQVVLGFDPDFYVQRGARFTLYVLRLAVEFAVSPITAASLGVALVLVIARMWRSAEIPRRAREFFLLISEWLSSYAAIVYSLLLVILLQHLFVVYDNVTSPLGISNLLFEDPAGRPKLLASEGTAVLDALIKENSHTLRLQFLFALIALAEAALFLFIAWRVTGHLKPRSMLLAPFVLIFAMTVVALPMIYGRIAIRNEFPIVRVSAQADADAPRSYFLMNATDDFLVLWDNSETRLIWVALGKIDHLEIGRKCRLPLAGTGRSVRPTLEGGCP